MPRENGDIESGFRNAINTNVPAWMAFVVFVLFSIVGGMSTYALSRASKASDDIVDLRVSVKVLEANRTSDKAESDRRFMELSNELRDANSKLDRVLREMQTKP